MAQPSPQQVGREFVRQYYTVLHEAPELLHRFYSSGSTFVHGGRRPTSGGERRRSRRGAGCRSARDRQEDPIARLQGLPHQDPTGRCAGHYRIGRCRSGHWRALE